MPSNRSTDSFFHNDDMPTSTTKSGQNRFAPNQSNRFGTEQGQQNNKFATDASNDSSFGYRFGDNKSNRNNYDQPNNRFADEPSFSNPFGGNGRDNFGNDSQDRFASNAGPNFAKNSNRFGQDQLTSSNNKFPSNSSQFNRFGTGQEPRSNSNSQESFTFEPNADPSNNNPFPKDQDDRVLSTFPNRYAPPEITKNFTNPFAQNAPNKANPEKNAASSFPAKDIKAEADVGRHSLNDNQRFLQNQTPNHFMLTAPPPNNQRNVFPNQSMNRFGNPDAFGRFDDFTNNSFNRPAFNMPPMNQPMNQQMNQQTNFIPTQPNLQQPPPNFPPNNSTSNMGSPFNNTAFGMNFSTPPPVNPSLLHSIPQPLPMSLNKIPPPKELDLNAIPEPQLNLVPSNYATSATG